MVLAPALLLLGTELTLRLAGYGYRPDFFLKRDLGGQSFWIQNEDFSRRFFPPETMRQPEALRMRAQKNPGATRIFVLGESAAMGDPEPAFGPARFLEVLLQEKFPGREFEIVNVAFTAINSHVLLPLARECAEHDGDLWIIYMGNNEMVGPYGAATVLGMQAPPRVFVRLVTALQSTRTGQLAMAVTRKFQSRATPNASWGGMAMFQKQRLAPQSPLRTTVHDNFAANLDDLVRCGLHAGAGLILNTVAVNLHDSPPFASLPDPMLAWSARSYFDELMQNARLAQGINDWTNAAGLFGQALEIDGGYAEAHYRCAMCLERAGQPEAARERYQLACDTDALPFRTDSRENALIRETAARHAHDRLLLVDAPKVLADGTAAGVCGEETFFEHVHFNFAGSYRLGRAWAQAVAQMLPKVADQKTNNEWASEDFCARRLGLTDFNRSLVMQSVVQRLQVPPLSGQFNNADRARQLAASAKNLVAQATGQTVQQGRALFAEALAARPEDHHVRESFAVFLQAVGDLDGALREWRKVGEMLPHDFLPWFELGSLLAKQGHFAESEKYLRQAIALRPGLVEGWNELGQCLGAQQQWAPALAAFERASQLKPEEPVFWAFRAKVLAGLERRTEAIDCYLKAVELNPAYAEAQAALGDELAQTARITEAIAAYQAAIAAKPGYAIAHLNLGVMYARAGRADEAVAQLRQALALEPDNATAKNLLQQMEDRRNQTR